MEQLTLFANNLGNGWISEVLNLEGTQQIYRTHKYGIQRVQLESPVEPTGCGLVCRVSLRVVALEAQSPWIMGAPSQLQVLYAWNSPHRGTLWTTGTVRGNSSHRGTLWTKGNVWGNSPHRGASELQILYAWNLKFPQRGAFELQIMYAWNSPHKGASLPSFYRDHYHLKNLSSK